MNTPSLIEPIQALARLFQRNAWLYLLNSILVGTSFSIYSLFFNLYILARGYPKDFLGFLSALPSAVALIAAIPLGMFSDRIGRRKAMIGGTLGAILAIVGIASGTNSALLVVAVVVLGMGNELFNISAAPFMMENSSERERTLLFSTSFGLSALSGFAGSLVGGQLPRWMSSVFVLTLDTAPAYGAALLISPALNLLAMFPLLWMREAARPTWNLRLVVPNARLVTLAAEDIWRQFKAAPVLTWRGLYHRQVIVKLLAPNVLISVGAALLIPYMNVFFRERHHVPDGTLGVIFALSSVVTGVATLAAPLLAQRWGKIRSVALAQAASLPFLLIIGFAPSLPLAVLAFWFRGALMNLGGPIYNAFTMEHVAKDERATVNAFSSVTWNIGWAVCPYLSGLVQQKWGFGPLFVMTSVLYGLAAALTYVFFAAGELKENRETATVA